jgi:D-beta-D-heptose 7-phosphate kinase/D-beta-D-heptose 1-phosphate adenosyltransferase
MLHPALPIIQQFKHLRVLILGDLMLDEYIWGTVQRISPEAPVPVVSVTSRTVVPGGAANVAANVAALGATVDVYGVVGTDQEGEYLRRLLASLSVNCAGLIADQNRPTSTKVRVIAERQQIVRMDREETAPIDGPHIDRLITAISDATESEASPDAIILSDYAKGCLTPDLLKEVIALARSREIFVAVDPKGRDFRKYRGVNMLTPNRHETEVACGFAIEHDGQLPHAMDVLFDQTDADGLLITLGKDGMAVGQRQPGREGAAAPSYRTPYWRIPSEAREVYDVTGAGDTVIGTFVLAYLASRSWEQAAHIANAAAGIVVGHVGTTTVRRQELLAHFRTVQRGKRSKLRSLNKTKEPR